MELPLCHPALISFSTPPPLLSFPSCGLQAEEQNSGKVKAKGSKKGKKSGKK